MMPKGSKFSDEHKRKISEALSGENNPMYGKHHSKEKRERIANSMIGPKNHFYGKKHTPETRLKMGGKNHHLWKGDNVSYKALHGWVRRNKPMVSFCESCRLVPPYDVANISSKKGAQTYNRDLNNWRWLCRRCHMESDGRLK